MYQEFAAVYDRFMDDFDYPAWADYYLEILKRQGYGGGEICECGCGTGSLSIELLKRGVKLISSDISEDMLRIASDKARRSGVRARFVREDMRALKLPHRVDAVRLATATTVSLRRMAQVRRRWQFLPMVRISTNLLLNWSGWRRQATALY